MATTEPQHFLNYHTELNMSTSHFLVLFWIHVPSYVINPANVTFTTLFSPGTKHSPCNENKIYTNKTNYFFILYRKYECQQNSYITVLSSGIWCYVV